MTQFQGLKLLLNMQFLPMHKPLVDRYINTRVTKGNIIAKNINILFNNNENPIAKIEASMQYRNTKFDVIV